MVSASPKFRAFVSWPRAKASATDRCLFYMPSVLLDLDVSTLNPKAGFKVKISEQ